MTFSLHQGGVVMSSQIKHTHSHQDTPLSPYTWHLPLDIKELRPFFSLYQPHHVTASYASTGDNQQSTGGRLERTQGKAKMAAWNSFSYICTTLPDLSLIDGQPPPSFLCCPRTPSYHPSSLTSVSLAPAFHLLPPSTPFWPYGTHIFFPHAQTISMLSDLLYSLTPFLFQLSYAPLHSQLYPFVTPQPNFSNTSSQEHSLSFSRHFSYLMPLLHPTPLVQLLLHINTSWPLSPVLYCPAHFSALPMLYAPHSFCVRSTHQYKNIWHCIRGATN